jgi:hypothetical protein
MMHFREIFIWMSNNKSLEITKENPKNKLVSMIKAFDSEYKKFL